jgi:hypothetical protein
MGEATKKGGRSRENQATKTLSIRGIRSSTMAFHSLELGFRDGDQVKKNMIERQFFIQYRLFFWIIIEYLVDCIVTHYSSLTG